MIDNFEQKFLDFARAKPEEEIYHAGDFNNCALAQFVKTEGFEPHAVEYCRPGKWEHGSGIFYPEKIYEAAVVEGPYTWGDLVSRLTR